MRMLVWIALVEHGVYIYIYIHTHTIASRNCKVYLRWNIPHLPFVESKSVDKAAQCIECYEDEHFFVHQFVDTALPVEQHARECAEFGISHLAWVCDCHVGDRLNCLCSRPLSDQCENILSGLDVWSGWIIN